MAEFQKVMEERQRMCDSYKSCSQCRINTFRDDICSVWITKNPKEAEQIIMGWVAEHPIKTNGIKFREVFGQPYEYLFEANGFIKQWLSQEYKGGQDEQN